CSPSRPWPCNGRRARDSRAQCRAFPAPRRRCAAVLRLARFQCPTWDFDVARRAWDPLRRTRNGECETAVISDKPLFQTSLVLTATLADFAHVPASTFLPSAG